MKLNNLQSKLYQQSLFIAMALTISISSNAQNSVAIASNKMNVLYIGVDNPVSIAAYGTTDDKVSVSIHGGGGTVSRLNTGSYIVRVTQISDDCTIQVNVDGKPVGASKFRVRALPAPSATVGGFVSGSNVSADAFKNQAGVATYLRDSPFEVKYEIVSYTFTIDTDKGDIAAATNNTSSFSQQTKQAIEQYVKPGKTVTIDNILARGADGEVRKLPSLAYFIK